jgi:hypothetical protein
MNQKNYFFSFLLIVLFGYSKNGFAQAPSKIPYQTIVRNASGNAISNSPVGVRFSILEDSINGNAVYTETHSGTTTNLGLLNLEIGSGTVVSGSLNNLSLYNHSYFLKVDVDPNGGNSYSISATSQLNSVPYAWHARSSDDWLRSGVNLSNLNTGNVGIGTSTPQEKLEVNGNIRFAGNSTKNLFNGSGTTNGANGGNLNISAGNAFYGSSGSNGGNLNLNGGNSNAAGGQAGGHVILQTGRNYWNNGFNAAAAHGDIIFRGGFPGSGQSAQVSEFMRMNGTTGFFGIGTAFPATRLDVNGTTKTANFQMPTGANNGSIMVSDAAGNASWASPGSIVGWENNGTDTYTSLTGNVGIGTITPGTKLDVAGTTRTQGLQLTTGAAANKVMVSDAIGNASWANAPGAIVSTQFSDAPVGAITDNTVYQFLGATENVTITAGQKVEVTASAGLGTTLPTGAQFNRVTIGYQLNSTGTIFDGGADWSIYKLINGQRDILTLNSIFGNLAAGTYKVGLVYIATPGNAAFFNANDWSRISAKVINP